MDTMPSRLQARQAGKLLQPVVSVQHPSTRPCSHGVCPCLTPHPTLRPASAQRLLVATWSSKEHRGWEDRWGPYSQASSGSAVQRLFVQALSQPLGDLSLDFDRSFINSRRRSSCIADAASIAEAEVEEHTSGTQRGARYGSGRRNSFSERDAEMCDVLLDFQRLVAGSGTSDTGSLLHAADLLSRHTSGVSHTEALQAEVKRLVCLVQCQLTAPNNHTNRRVGSQGNRAQHRPAASSALPGTSAGGAGKAAGDSPGAAAGETTTQVSGTRAAALVQAINKAMYGGPDPYCGNCHDFYHPHNNLLYQVVANKTGSPAALALLYWEVARQVGLPMEVLLLPGHTFLRPTVPGGSSWLVDPFNGGQVCSQQVVEARLNNNWGLAAPQLSLARHQPLITPAHAGPTAAPAVSTPEAKGSVTQSSSSAKQQQEQPEMPGRSYAGTAFPLHADVADVAERAADLLGGARGGAAAGAAAQHGAHVQLRAEQAGAQQRQQEPLCRAAGGVSLHPGSAPGALLLRLLCNQRESYYCPLPASGFLRWNAHMQQTLVWRGLWTTRLMRSMVPGTAYLVRDEGYALLQMGMKKEGMELLRAYLADADGAEDLRRVQEWIVPD